MDVFDPKCNVHQAWEGPRVMLEQLLLQPNTVISGLMVSQARTVFMGLMVPGAVEAVQRVVCICARFSKMVVVATRISST